MSVFVLHSNTPFFERSHIQVHILMDDKSGEQMSLKSFNPKTLSKIIIVHLHDDY